MMHATCTNHYCERILQPSTHTLIGKDKTEHYNSKILVFRIVLKIGKKRFNFIVMKVNTMTCWDIRNFLNLNLTFFLFVDLFN